MQATFLNKLTSPVRFFAAGTSVVLFLAFTLFSAALAKAQTTIVITGSSTQVGILGGTYGGGWDGSASPLGGTFVVGANGNVIVGDGYTGNQDALQITPSGTETVLASGSGANSSAAAVDGYGNVYIGFEYNGVVFKLPYNAATGAYAGYTAAPTANCTGGTSDTAACVFAPNLQVLTGIAGMAFDPQGDIIVTTDANGGTKNAIYVCNAACQAETDGKGTNAAIEIFTDGSTNIGAVAVDPWGDIFFIDGANNGGNTGKVSNLKEIQPTSPGTYSSSSTPTTVETYTTTAGYNGLSGVTIGGNGTVFFATNSDGIFAIPNTSSGPTTSAMYQVSTFGGKAMTLDALGNFYQMNYNSGDVVSFLPTQNFQMGATTVGGTAATASGTVVDDGGSCSSAPTLTVASTEFGVSSSEFSPTLGTTCSTPFGAGNGTFGSGTFSAAAGVSYSLSLSFSAAAVGERNAALTVTDSTDSAQRTGIMTGVGQGAMANVDPGVATAYTTGLTTPASVVADPAGDLFVADSGAGKVFEYPAGSTSSTTPTAIGSGFTKPVALAFGANGNLYVADSGADDVVQIPNTGTTGAFVAGTQTTLIPSSLSIGGAALSSPTGLAFGPSGTLYISDTGNKRVVFYNFSGQSGVTLAQAMIENGTSTPLVVETPSGIAVDSSGDLYVADAGEDSIDVVSSAGLVSSVTPPGVTAAVGVAVEPSGSIIVADSGSANIVRIPYLSGAFSTSQAVTIETISPSANSLAMDSLGDLYVASSGGVTANAILRNSASGASINLGIVADGANNTGTVDLMDSGNQPATLADVSGSDVTEPASFPTFQLNVPGTDGCTPGSSSGSQGNLCTFTAEFAPPAGTTPGAYNDTADILVGTPSLTIPVAISGTASASAAVAQTITFSPPATGYVGQVIALSATVTSPTPPGPSGLAVTFTTSTSSVCTLSGTSATFIATGTCTIYANQAGGSVSGNLYGAAPQVTKSIIISNATTAGVPSLLMTQFQWIYGSGTYTDGENPMGGSFAITQDGQIVVGTSYSGTLDFINANTGALNQSVSIAAGGITIDSNNNLYISHLYNNIIYKLPYLGNGTYATLVDAPSPAPPACQGGTLDTAQCTFVTYPSSPAATGGQNSGLHAIAFDPSGNFYMVTEPSETASGASYIFECNTSCQPAGTGTLLYSDTNGISQIAFDPWGNLFFTDANYLIGASNATTDSGASSSTLSELPYTASTTSFASTPTVLETYSDGSGAGNYDNMLSSVAVNSSGTIYYSVLYNGTYAIPNSQAGGPVVADQYAISGQGAKALELDGDGNIYLVDNGSGTSIAGTAISGDIEGRILIDDLTVPGAQYDGAPSTAAATVVDNAFPCSDAATLAYVSSNSEFSAANGTGGCTSIGGPGSALSGSFPVTTSSYPAVLTFTATAPNAQTATLTVTDTTNGGEGSAALTSFGLTTPQTISFTAPANNSSYTYAAPPNQVTIPLSVANGGSNFPVAFTVDPKSTGAGTISTTTVSGTTSSATLTVTAAGTIQIDATEPAGLSGGVYYNNSNTATVTIVVGSAGQTITFTAISPSTYTYDASPQVTIPLSATGGASGNPVTFSVDASSTGAGTISASTVVGNASLATLTVTQAGTITIDANQAANQDYAAAAPVQQTITVNQAAQTLTFIPPTAPVHFIAASSGVAGGITVPVSAIGGGSDNPIVFTVDKASTMTGSFGTSTVSGATSTATLTIPLQGSVTSGIIVIDATQPASTDYAQVSAAPLGTITILAPLPTQLITFNNPGTQVVGTPLTLGATASSGLAVSYVSTTASVCTVNGSAVTFASSVTTSSSCTLVASQPGDNINWAAAPSVTQTFTVNPEGQSPNVNLSLSLNALTLEPGTVGLTQLTVTSQNNFTGALALACTGLPSGYGCTFNPSSVTINEDGTITTTLTIAPPATASVVRHGTRPLIPVTAVAVVLCFFGFRKRSKLLSLMLLVFAVGALALLSACGGSKGAAPSVPGIPGSPSSATSTATITVSASGGMAGASGTVTQTATIQVTVQ